MMVKVWVASRLRIARLMLISIAPLHTTSLLQRRRASRLVRK
jgi:hypothetical protein